jgi:excisionase family DNA binding protein
VQEQRFLTPDEVADLLRCRPEKIYRILGTKELPSIRLGGRRLIERTDLEAYIASHKTG